MNCLRIPAAFGALLLLPACSIFGLGASSDAPKRGFVVGDEPYAVQAGATVLAHGGNAVDAVTATYFALAVTYPVSAGLGGGGLCIVRDSATGKTAQFDFLARDAKADAKGAGDYAVPGNVSGFSLLQATYGRLPWQRVVSPAEGFAAAGFPVSRALAARLEQSQDVIRLDATLSAEFLDESGHVKTAGTYVVAPMLGQTLSAIRTFGPAGFYRGPVANGIASYANAAGGGPTSADLLSYTATRSAPASMTIGDEAVFLPSADIGAGKFAQALFSHLADAQGQITAGDNLGGAVASATKATMDAFGLASLPRDLGATGFAAEDGDGQAVACAVTMNGPFGSGHSANATGVTLARAPHLDRAGLAAGFLTPVIATSGDQLALVGAGAGGPNGTAAIGLAVLELARGVDVTQPGAVRSTGIAPFDTVNVIACQNELCTAIPDPGALGLGAVGTP